MSCILMPANRPMDQDELLDYADQGPLQSPTATAVPGPLAQFLSDMPDFMEGIEESLQRALDSLPVPRPGPSPDGISIEVMPSISKISCYIRYRSSFLRFVYTISYTNLRYRSMLNTISVETYSISMLNLDIGHDIGCTILF